jgi:cytochrome P450
MNSAAAGRTANGAGGPRVAHPEINVTMDDLPAMHEALAAMREEAPVVEVRCNGERAWIVLTYAALRDALRDEATFPSAASYSRTTDPATGRTLNSMQGDEHTRNRAVVSPAFRRQRMAAYHHEVLEPVCQRVVERFAGTSPVDLRAVLTHRLPMEVITRLLGLPAEDSDALERWSNALFTYPFDPDGALAAKAEFTAFLEPVLEQRREEPGDDLISTLVGGEFHGRTLADEEILSFLRLLFPAGTHNTTNAIGNLFFALLEQPERFARVRDDVDAREWAIEEALRWEPPVGNLPRRVRAEGATFHGVELPPDGPMVYSFAAAGRDPAMFPDPDRFDLDRRPQEMLTFGLGEHFCLGAWLGRQEMRVALDVVIERTRHVELLDVEAARPRGGSLRGPEALPVSIEW